MTQITCGEKITEADYQALFQDERKRLAQLVKEMRAKDKLTPDKELRERTYHIVTAESIPFN